MAQQKKAKNPKYMTPRAVASYPYFNKPDEYKGKTQYKAKLIMDAETAEPLIEQCKTALTNYVEAFNKEAEANGTKKLNLKKALVTGLPFEEHEEDENKVVFNVKQNAEVLGEKVVLVVYDSKGKRIKNPPIIRGGSVVKVAGTMRGYEGFGGGISLSISAVQIIELAERGGNLDDGGEAFGFSEEEGFEADEAGFTDEPDGFEQADDDNIDDADGDF